MFGAHGPTVTRVVEADTVLGVLSLFACGASRGSPRWRKVLFAFLSRNTRRPTAAATLALVGWQLLRHKGALGQLALD